MVRATWNGQVLAESNDTILIEGNHYFPPDAVNMGLFAKSSRHTICPWKGTASYYDVKVNGQVNRNAAWYYPKTKPAAKPIRGYIAFWRGVRVEKVD
jgi:uncharacterized protein (DUF427 family)